jgi:hypothetical protein
MTERGSGDQLAERIILGDCETDDDILEDVRVFEIIDDRKVSYEGRSVEIRPDAVALNGLLKTRGRWSMAGSFAMPCRQP